MKAKIHVTLKSGVLDPQGKAVGHALDSLGFNGIGDVRQGKFIEIDLDETDAAAARENVEDMCKQLLANTVIENFEIEIEA
jgi:phosphoribosylformylglycinamidine synthase PurS subunit